MSIFNSKAYAMFQMGLALIYFVIVLISVLAHCRNYGILIEAKLPAMPLTKHPNTVFTANNNLISLIDKLEIALLVVIFIDLLVKLINDYSVKKVDFSCNKISKE